MLTNGSVKDFIEYQCIVREIKFAEEILEQLKEAAAGDDGDEE